MQTIGDLVINVRANTASYAPAMRQVAATTRQTATEVRASMMEARGCGHPVGRGNRGASAAAPAQLRGATARCRAADGAAFSGIAVVGLIMVMASAISKATEFAKSLGELSKAEKEYHDKAVKDAKDELQFQTTILKAQYELNKAKAETPAARANIQIQEDIALVRLHSDYVGKLQKDLDELKTK